MDSANILSILQGLEQSPQDQAGPPNNVMQVAAPAPSLPQPSTLPAPADVAQAAVAASPPTPKPRRSLVDIIGHLADGLAQVGGATPMYQRTLDAMQAHNFAAQNQASKVDLDKLDLATKQAALTTTSNTNADSERSRFANVLGAVNDTEDAGNLPAMMQAAGLTDPRYAPFIRMVQSDPNQAKVLASALGGGGDDATVKYGGNIIYGKDAKGNIHAYQANITGGSARDVLPEGITPVDPLQFVNTGGAQVGVGKNSGVSKLILPNSVSPNTAASNAQSDKNNQRTTGTALTIAGMPARPKVAPAGAANGSSSYIAARTGLTNLSAQLDKIINDPDLGHSVGPVGFVMRHLPGTAAQRVEGDITTAQGQALVGAINNLKALSANGNLGFRLTQQEANAFGASLAGALKNTNQSPTDYANNLRDAQTRIQTMISQLDQDAKTKGYTGSSQPPSTAPAGANPAAIAEARRRGLIH